MEVSERLGNEDPFLQTLFQETAVRYDVQHHQSVHQDAGTVGQPADEEAENEDDGCFQCFLPHGLTLGVLGQFGDDDTVAGQDDQTWEQKANNDVLETESSLPRNNVLLGIGVRADRVLASAVDFSEHKIRHGEEGRGQPNSEVDHFLCQKFPEHMAFRGTDNGQISVQTDEGQDEHAAVQIQGVDHVDRDAEKAPEMPSADGVHSPEGQSYHKQKVSDGEVQSVFICHVLRLLLVAHHEHHKSIANNSKDKNNPIYSREEDLRKVIADCDVTKAIKHVKVSRARF